ncbi:HDIG domain-containing protein [Rhodocaloribacter litoris]|uniref:HDIG domain-containing metalloprotein n=1 Tax=Rhodocaloribacter litoris TaxID=2558931 RepID=UPI0014248003|nr:HDIG domain-containing metalloprotein [Rhodocaloribacter litoris]QXD16534.1 HDIG domain-containing protein [Rhodocaloribacter litoris]
MPSYDDALTLFHEWTQGESLRRHAYAVEAAMGHYARLFGEDETLWRITGLLHDMDYERHPTPEEHPYVGTRVLRAAGYPDEVIEAILGHAEYTGTPRTTRLAKTLFAVDELAGFITAVAYVRPTGLADLTPKSVKKKLKDKAFAAAVSREDIRRGAEELGLDLDTHIANVIAGMQADAERLGFG